ncbi:MAG: hypothetical protein LUM44_10180 [Pyrinomonadaceae bacterium]|nr:hypothetical protein [Pyrinomonadaceae bacterium]
MKFLQKIIPFFTIFMWIGIMIIYAQNDSVTVIKRDDYPLFYTQNKDFIDKLILVLIGAILGAILGFISTYLSNRRKERREEKELSYEIERKGVITKDETPIKDRIGISYNHNQVNNLSFIMCKVRNTGEVVVKDEKLRFEFPNDLVILENYLDPKPEPEINVTEVNEVQFDRKSFERIFNIGHLVKDKSVVFNFVVDGSNTELKIHDFNEGGDVKFNEASVNIAKNDAEILREFFFVNLILALIYPLLHADILNFIILGELLWAIIFIGLNMRFIKPLTRMWANYIVGRKMEHSKEMKINGGENIIMWNTTQSKLSITKPNIINGEVKS